MGDHYYRAVRAGAWLVLSFGALVYVAQYARFVDRSYSSQTFSVDGTADVDVTPDLAMFTVTVTTEGGNDVSALQRQNAEKMNRVTQYMKENGIDAKDLKTREYNLFPRYSNPICQGGVCPEPSIIGYTVTQSLEVKVREAGKIGGLLSGAVENGGNGVSQVQFVVDDDTEARNMAREEAIKEAREKAEATARAGGFQLGRLVTFYEMPEEDPSPLPYGGMGGDAAQSMRSSVAPSLEPGTQSGEVRVTLTFEIVQ